MRPARREAARVILLNEHDQVLLLHGHDKDDPAHSWWFTLGGGIEDDEDVHGAALREVREEVGITLERDQLVGPVAVRQTVFSFARSTLHQDEVYFVALVLSEQLSDPLDTSAWTTDEAESLDGVAWWDIADLPHAAEKVYPEELAAFMAVYVQGWRGVVQRWR